MAAENLLAARTDPASLARDFPAGRNGVSVMPALDMPESIVQNEQEWLTRPVELISYRVALRTLGTGLRDRIRRSPLMDAAACVPAGRTCLSPRFSRPVLRRGKFRNAVAAAITTDSRECGNPKGVQATGSDMRRW